MPRPDIDERRPTGMAGMRRAFSSLGIYNYRLYWLGQLVSLTGTWMQRLAQAWLVLRITHSPFQLGTVTMIQFLPITLFSLFGGVVADRLPKRRLLIVTQSIAATQAIVLATLTSFGLIQIWHIYLLALMLGMSNAFDNPARQSFPVELVGREEVANAIALNSTLFNTSRIAGPSLAGIAIATIGVAGCFWLNAFSFLGTIVALSLMKPALFFAAPPRQRRGTVSLLKEGLRYAAQTPSVAVMMIALIFLGTFAYNFNVVLPLLATYTLKTGSLGYGFMFAGLGAGSLVAALTLAYTRAQSVKTVFIGGSALLVMMTLLGLSHTYLLSLGLLAVLGAFSISYSASTQTRLQVIVPDAMRGRTMSLYTLFFAGTTPFGSLFIGAISDHWDPGTALIISAALSASGIVLAWWYLHRQSPADLIRGTVLATAAEPLYTSALPIDPPDPVGVPGAVASTSLRPGAHAGD
ncbi:MAG: MFS transporter [Dehalococcoidia bacterium]